MSNKGRRRDLDKSLNCPPAGGWQPGWGLPANGAGVCVLLSVWEIEGNSFWLKFFCYEYVCDEISTFGFYDDDDDDALPKNK